MKNILTLALFAAAIALFSCAGNQEGKTGMTSAQVSEQDALYQSVMVVHDSVMPKMGDLARLAQEIRKLIPNDATDDETKERAYTIVQKLNIAEENMMGWMNQIKQPAALRDTSSHEAIMQYFQAEKSKIDQVGKDINGSMNEAIQFLNGFKGAEE